MPICTGTLAQKVYLLTKVMNLINVVFTCRLVLKHYNDIHNLKAFSTMLLVVKYLCACYIHLIAFFTRPRLKFIV